MREDKPDFDEAPELLSGADLAAAQAGVPVTTLAPDPKPTATPDPVEPAVPASGDTPEVDEPIIETVPTDMAVTEPDGQEGSGDTPADPLEEIRAELARAKHDNAVIMEHIMGGQTPETQAPVVEQPEEIVFPTLEFTADELVEAQTSEEGFRAYSAKIAQHNTDVAAAVEQKMLRNIQAVMPKVIVNAVQNEITRRENVAKGDAWEAAHPEFAGQIPRVMQILVRQTKTHPDWSIDKHLEELGPTASKELCVPLRDNGKTVIKPPSPVVTPGARPAPSVKPKLTAEQRECADLNTVFGPK